MLINCRIVHMATCSFCGNLNASRIINSIDTNENIYFKLLRLKKIIKEPSRHSVWCQHVDKQFCIKNDKHIKNSEKEI